MGEEPGAGSREPAAREASEPIASRRADREGVGAPARRCTANMPRGCSVILLSLLLLAASSLPVPCKDEDAERLTGKLVYWLQKERASLDAQMDSVPQLRAHRHLTDALRKLCEYSTCLKDRMSADILQSAESLSTHLRKRVILQGGVVPEVTCTCDLPLGWNSITSLWNLQRQTSAVLHAWILELQDLKMCS